MRELLGTSSGSDRWIAPGLPDDEPLDEVLIDPSEPHDAVAPEERPPAGPTWWRRPRTVLPLVAALVVGVAFGVWGQSARDAGTDRRAAESAVSLAVLQVLPGRTGPGNSIDISVEVYNAGPQPVTLLDVQPAAGLEAVGAARVPARRIEPGERGDATLEIQQPRCELTEQADELLLTVRTADGHERVARVSAPDLSAIWLHIRCGPESFVDLYQGMQVTSVQRVDARTTRLELAFRPVGDNGERAQAQIEDISTRLDGVQVRVLSRLPVRLAIAEDVLVTIELTVPRCADVSPVLDWDMGILVVDGRAAAHRKGREEVDWADTPVAVAMSTAIQRACPDVELS